MCSKTLAALISGCLISISLMLNLNHILPFAIDTRLLISLIVSFPLWIFAMIWCFNSINKEQAWLRCFCLLGVSIAINSVFILIQG